MVKQRSKNEQKKQQMLDSATKLFTEQGYASTSMDHIAKDADVSKQTVYSHFGSKEELFAASIKRKCDAYNILDYSKAEIIDVRTTLNELARRFFAMLMSKETLAIYRICSYESRSYPELAELFFKEGPELVANEVAQLFERFNEEGLLAVDDTYFAAQQFLHMLKGETWMRMEFNTAQKMSPQETEKYLSSCVELFIRGYAVK